MTKESRAPQRYTGFLLRRAQQRHVAAWFEILGPDTTSVQYGVMAVLERKPGYSQKEICEELDIDRSTVADLCARLEKNGMVIRTQAPEDRRRNVLELSEAGKTEIKRMRPLIEKVQEKVTAGLTPAEHEQFRKLLYKMLDG